MYAEFSPLACSISDIITGEPEHQNGKKEVYTMSTDYDFFFDESFHDRKITAKQFARENFLDYYIGLFWGTRKSNIPAVTESLEKIEHTAKKQFTIQGELKSTIINGKHYTYGLKSFNHLDIDFYNSIFDCCLDQKLKLQVNFIGKGELLWRSVFPFSDWYEANGFLYKKFIYSLAKLIRTYQISVHPPLQDFYNGVISQDEFVSLLTEKLRSIYHAGNGIKRKAREINAITQIIHIISKPQIPIRNQYSVDWTYHESFDGLYNLLKNDLHINPSRVNIFIDNEINTIKAANATHRFKSVEELDSANDICIRLSDWLAGFVGRLLFSIEHDSAALEPNETELKNTAPAEFAKLRLLSDHWFDLSRDQFECYRRAYNVFIGKQIHYWTLMTCVSIDGVSKFSNMLKYFNSYESYEEFKKTPAKTHSEKYNHAVCVELEHHYRQIV